IAHEIHGQLSNQLVGFAGKFVALALFLADGKQTYTRMLGAGKLPSKNTAKVNVAHDGELLQVLRLGIDISADVDEDGGRALRGRKYRGQCGAVHAGDCAQNHFGGRHGRAGVAGGDKTGGLAVAYQAKTDAQGRVTLAAHRLRRLLLHTDDFTSIDDANGEPAPEWVQVEFGADQVLFAHQQDFHVVVARRENGTFHFGFGRAVRAHGVNSDGGWHVCLSVANLRNRQTEQASPGRSARALLWSTAQVSSEKNTTAPELAGTLCDLDDLAPLIVTALRAGAMRQFALVTVGALGQRLRRQMIVGAALGRTRLGMTSFRIRHSKPRTRTARAVPCDQNF